MKLKLTLIALLTAFCLTGIGQDFAAAYVPSVEVMSPSDKEIHVYHLDAQESSLTDVKTIMDRYSKYLEYSATEKDGEVLIKVSAIEDPDQMLMMKRAMISLQINELNTSDGVKTVDEFYSKYSLQR